MSEPIARSSSIRPNSIINDVAVIVQPNVLEPTPTDQAVVAPDSQANYGVQSITIDQSPLATDEDALLLAEYLIRSEPNFWFTGLSINMHALTAPQRDAVATLEIGDFVGVVKSFKYGIPPVIQKNLYVEGISHRINPQTHNIDLHFSPVGYSQQWDSVTPTLTWQAVPAGLSWSNLIWTIL